MSGGPESQERVVAGRYRLRRRLGSGGMGTVWHGEDVVLGRDVAIKEVTFPPGTAAADRETLRERIRREARAAAQLDHSAAVTLHDVVEDGAATYLVMQYVPAETLSEVIDRQGPLTPQQTAQVGLAVLGALRAAHERGIVHRDVKPSNVLLSGHGHTSLGRVFLTDFGIALSAGDPSLTSTGVILGSPGYMAPERARGALAGPESDLWSLGATMFTAVEGRAPYVGDDVQATLSAVMVGDHAPYMRAGPLRPVLSQLLERDPSKRITATQLENALVAIASSPVSRSPVAAWPPPPDVTDPDVAAETALLRIGSNGAAPLAAAAKDNQLPTSSSNRRTPARQMSWRLRLAILVAAALVAVGLFWTVSPDDDDSSSDPGAATTAPSQNPTSVPLSAAPATSAPPASGGVSDPEPTTDAASPSSTTAPTVSAPRTTEQAPSTIPATSPPPTAAPEVLPPLPATAQTSSEQLRATIDALDDLTAAQLVAAGADADEVLESLRQIDSLEGGPRSSAAVVANTSAAASVVAGDLDPTVGDRVRDVLDNVARPDRLVDLVQLAETDPPALGERGRAVHWLLHSLDHQVPAGETSARAAELLQFVTEGVDEGELSGAFATAAVPTLQELADPAAFEELRALLADVERDPGAIGPAQQQVVESLRALTELPVFPQGNTASDLVALLRQDGQVTPAFRDVAVPLLLPLVR